MIPVLLTGVVGSTPTRGIVGLNGHTVNALTTESNKDSEAGVRFNSDGTVDQATNENEAGFVYLQIDTATDWIIPNVAVSRRTFHIRATEVSESETPIKTGTMDTWINLDTSPQWDANRDRLADDGTSQWVVDFEISDDGGSTILVGPSTYTMNAAISV